MKVCVISLDIQFKEPEVNRRAAEQVIRQHPGCDLYVLPEFFTVGFASDFTQFAEDAASSPTVAWMKQQAAAQNALVCGSVVVRDTWTLRNRFYFVTASKVAHYDKHHLFSVGGEDKTLSASDSRVFVTYKGFRIQPLICYDLRFPCFSNNYADLIIYVANWPVQRVFAWKHLLIARAIENQAFVVGCNRSGSDPCNVYEESSAVLDFMGQQLGAGNVIVADLDLAKQKAFRAAFNVQNDRDVIQIKGVNEDLVFEL